MNVSKLFKDVFILILAIVILILLAGCSSLSPKEGAKLSCVNTFGTFDCDKSFERIENLRRRTP